MEYIQDYLIDKLLDITTGLITFSVEKIYDYSKEKISNINKEKAAELPSKIGENFLFFFNSSLINKKDYKNDAVFKRFDLGIVDSIIREIFEKENIEPEIESKLKEDLEQFNSKDKSDNLAVLLINKDKKDMAKFLKTISNNYKFEKVNDNEFSFNIELKNNFKIFKKINIVNNFEALDLNKEFKCAWYFPQNDKTENDDELLQKLKENNIQIIYVHHKDNIDKEKKSTSEEEIENEDDIIIKSFNHFVFDNNNFINLIEKSLFNILIKIYQKYITHQTQEIFEKIIKKVGFIPGSNINKINSLIGQFVKMIFSFLLYKNKPVSEFGKSKCSELLDNHYLTYLKENEKSYYSEFVNKFGNDYISKLKETNSKKITELTKKGNLTKKEIEELEHYEKMKELEIKFIEQIDKQKEKQKDGKINENDYDEKLKMIFDDYYLLKSGIFIIEAVIICIKKTYIKYYEKYTFDYYMSLHKDEEIYYK